MTLTVYHMDDEVQALERFERLFQRGVSGNGVALKSFTQEGLLTEALRSRPDVDVFILDVYLGDSSPAGVHVAARCRELYPKAIILMCSSASDLGVLRSCLKAGADDFLAKDASPDEILSRVEIALMRRDHDALSVRENHEKLAGDTLRAVRERVSRLMGSAVNCVYIHGESGTGKEVVARMFESALPGKNPFIKVNCGALTPSLLMSELFGYVKGAFTGALNDKMGLIEAASGGWIFLDEIATLSPEAQAALLRAIDNQSVRRVGATRETAVSFRVLSATNESLAALVEQGKFRRDLWQRLIEARVDLPPLRERAGEIPELVSFFCESMRGGPYQTEARVLEILRAYDWREGNVRELRNCLRAMTEKASGNLLTPASVPEHIWKAVEGQRAARDLDSPPARDESITIGWDGGGRPSYEELSGRLLIEMIRRISSRERGLSLRSLALALGIPKSTLQGKLRRLVASGALSHEDIDRLMAKPNLRE